jgi:hypothetical protein
MLMAICILQSHNVRKASVRTDRRKCSAFGVSKTPPVKNGEKEREDFTCSGEDYLWKSMVIHYANGF